GGEHPVVQVVFEHRIVVVPHHQGRQAWAQHVQLLVGRGDLVASQRVQCGQRCRVERRHNQFAVCLQVVQSGSDQPFVCWSQNPIVQRFLQLERLRLHGGEPVAPIVDRESEPVAGGCVGQV